MWEVTILWDDGAMFVLPSVDDESPIEAVGSVWEALEAHEHLRGRWMGPDGVPQEQFRLAILPNRGIRAVMVDVE